eukprot:13008260-Alexandrium_andersonii.AAC.1
MCIRDRYEAGRFSRGVRGRALRRALSNGRALDGQARQGAAVVEQSSLRLHTRVQVPLPVA